jgi:hypothetical protein
VLHRIPAIALGVALGRYGGAQADEEHWHNLMKAGRHRGVDN